MKVINIGVIGAGGFAYFAVTEFVKIPGVKLFGVYDELESQSIRFKKIDSTVTIYSSLNDLCEEGNIDLIYIATPPGSHYEQSKAALIAGKHVICEKPAATELAHAVELRGLAVEKNLLYVVNLMQRYNPLYSAVKQLIEGKVLGSFLHGFFENYASDEFLPPQHWFWDYKMSGGIFIEHGVHFFDMFSGWLGEGRVIAAQKMNRPHYENVWDKYQATVLYSNGLVNFYHGFDQPKIMDRQEMRLQFEKGEITLYEWVPTHLRMTALCSQQELDMLNAIFQGAKIEILEQQDGNVKGRFEEIKYQYKVLLTYGNIQKMELYKELVTAMFSDQMAWINDRTHARKINQDNAVNSLKSAVDAEQLSVKLFA